MPDAPSQIYLNLKNDYLKELRTKQEQYNVKFDITIRFRVQRAVVYTPFGAFFR